MAIKTISQFDAATPTSNDKILIEQNGDGKSATLADLPISKQTQTELDAKVNTSNVLTFEEIQATTNLTGKVAGADALKSVNNKLGYFKIFGNYKVNENQSITISGFENLRTYLIIDSHITLGCGLYVVCAGYGVPMELWFIGGGGSQKIKKTSSTTNSLTLKSSLKSSLLILQMGEWEG